MVRCLLPGVVLVILACPPSGVAQTKPSPGFGERFKSLFTRSQEPVKREGAPEKAPKLPSKPVQVTTRSGVLRQPGPEQAIPGEMPATPTFAPAAPLANQPKSLKTTAEEKRPLRETSSRRRPVRDPGVRPAGFEARPERPTMASWFRGLWSRKDKPETPTKRLAQPEVKRPPSPNQPSSIDPRKVYRGPSPQAAPADPRSGTGRGSDFSEIGVPRSSTDFRGRRDTSF